MQAPSLPLLETFRAMRAWRNDRIGVLHGAHARFGDVGQVHLPGRHVFVVTSAEVAHAALVEEADAFVKSLGLRIFARPLLGDGLLTSEHEAHRRQRRLIAPALTAKRIASYADAMVALTREATSRWHEGQAVDVSDEMMRLTLAIVARTLFDTEVNDEAAEIGRAMMVAQAHVIWSATHLIRLPGSFPTPRNVRFRAAIGRLDQTIYRMIAERRARLEDRGDVLSMLLLAQEEGTGARMDDKQVRDEAMTLFLAGHETTANGLAWALHLLAEHPEVAARLHAEVDTVLAGRPATYADLPRLGLARRVFDEAMRLYPPAYLVGREATRDVTLAGLSVPRGAIVFINIAGMHRREDYFRDASRFDPDRFTPERAAEAPRGAYLPFGGGPRVCIGNHFALMEGQLVLATLAQRVRFEALAPGPLRTEPLITLRPRGGFPARVWRRVA